MSACPDCNGRGAYTVDPATGKRVFYCDCDNFEPLLTASVELAKLRKEVRALTSENVILKAHIEHVEDRYRRLTSSTELPAMLKVQA